jgi:hypothetical protein
MSNTIGWGKAVENNTIGYGDGKDNSTNGWGSAYENSWSGETLLEVLLTAPVNVSAPVVSGTASVGSVLTTTNGTWDNEPTSYTYQWKRNGSNILSATANTYTVVAADVSQSITCTVTATNDAGSASATSNTITPTWETDAQAFITAAAITDPTQQSAVNQLVVDLKGYGVWTKMKALYPFVGGTASQHKFNLKNPLDTNAAFRLVFNGGWTHSATGALPNGTNAWANTFFVSANNFASKDNAHYSFYSRTNLASDGIEIGVNDAPSNQGLYTRSAGGNATFILNGSATFPNVATANSLGFYQANRNALNTISGWKNGIKLSQISSISVVSTFPSFSIGAYNMNNLTANYYSSKQCAFASLGDGLTDTEASNFYTAVQTFQTALNRQV